MRRSPILVLLLLVGCATVRPARWPEASRAFDVVVTPRPAQEETGEMRRFSGTPGSLTLREERAGDLRFEYTDLELPDAGLRLSLFSRDLPPGGSTLETGRSYRFELLLRKPAYGSLPLLAVYDGEELIFFGVTETEPDRVRTYLPEGWSVALEESGFGERRDLCGVLRKPRALLVRRGSETVRLLQGREALLGGYTVACHAAQQVDYRANACSGNLVPALSLVIRRLR